MRVTFLLTIALSSPIFASAETVFCGRALSHEFIEGVEIPCPPGFICPNSWYRWKFQVETVLSGPQLSPQVVVAATQHGQYTQQYEERLRLFTIKPIMDEEKRKLLGADFRLIEMLPGNQAAAAPCTQNS